MDRQAGGGYYLCVRRTLRRLNMRSAQIQAHNYASRAYFMVPCNHASVHLISVMCQSDGLFNLVPTYIT